MTGRKVFLKIRHFLSYSFLRRYHKTKKLFTEKMKVSIAFEIWLLIIILFSRQSICSNSKIKMVRVLHSFTNNMFENSSFRNLDDGIVIANKTTVLLVKTYNVYVSSRIETYSYCTKFLIFD